MTTEFSKAADQLLFVLCVSLWLLAEFFFFFFFFFFMFGRLIVVCVVSFLEL